MVVAPRLRNTPRPPEALPLDRDHPARLLTFALDGTGTLPALPKASGEKPLADKSLVPDPALAATGTILYYSCGPCHGGNARSVGSAPDLRASAIVLSAQSFDQVVRKGSLVARGMPAFGELSDAQMLALRHYIRGEANRALATAGH